MADYFTNAVAACQPINCWIFSSQSNPHWGQPWNQFYQYEWTGEPPSYNNPFITMDKTTGVFTFNRDRVFSLRIEFRCDNGFQQFDYTFTLDVACTATSTSLALPAGFTHLPKYAISLTDVMEPYYEFTDFTTTENKCPIMERNLYGDAAYSAPVSNGLLDLVQRRDSGVQNQYTYFVQTAGPYKYLKGKYEFYIEAKARGGALIRTGKVLLEVYCGPLSTNITETTYDSTQSAEVGSLHGFYFTNYSSFSDCPVFTY